MANQNMIDLEYKKLKSLYNNVEESKSKLVDNLIQQAFCIDRVTSYCAN